MNKNIILHPFQWKLVDIISSLPKIKDQGFTAIQITPIQPCKKTFNPLVDWWACYQPLEFSIGNRYGTKDELIQLCNEAKKYDIRIIADVVCNHVASKDNDILTPHDDVDKKLICNPYFWKPKENINNWNDRYRVITYCSGLPTLQLSNYDLQDIIIEFLNELVDCGVGGFRFDSAKNIQLPSENSDFWIRVLDNIKNKDKLFSYAEVIFGSTSLTNSYCKYINVATKSSASDKNKIVNYAESHDEFLEFKFTRFMNDCKLVESWGSLMDEYNNMLFYIRPFDNPFCGLWMDPRIKEINTRHLLND